MGASVSSLGCGQDGCARRLPRLLAGWVHPSAPQATRSMDAPCCSQGLRQSEVHKVRNSLGRNGSGQRDTGAPLPSLARVRLEMNGGNEPAYLESLPPIRHSPILATRGPWCHVALGINLACYDERDKQGLRTKTRVQEYNTQGLGGANDWTKLLRVAVVRRYYRAKSSVWVWENPCSVPTDLLTCMRARGSGTLTGPPDLDSSHALRSLSLYVQTDSSVMAGM
ncbi:hypothetical protein B0H10DRAFT_1967484 [Mycena sp. CBHHK59/15]|nr:hypothetical protein B0H10DRAFT_1967484 [Mycena sp. CBHHK59/15]